MNCYIHTDKPAVTTCPECGMGLCRDCVDNSVCTLDNKPLCHNCSLQTADSELSEARSRRLWSLVKMIFGACFLVLGVSVFYSTGDLMNAWIYAGIAGIPAAFKSTRASRRQQIRNEIDDAFAPGMADLASNWMIRIIVRLALVILFAPIMATISVFKNLFVFIGSSSDIKKAQQAYDYLASEQDIAVVIPDDAQLPNVSYPSNVESAIPVAQPTSTEDKKYQAYQPQPSVQSGIVGESVKTDGGEEQKFVIDAQPERQTAPVVSSSKNNSVVVISILVGVLLAVGGALAYFYWYAPYMKDKNAPRTYVVATNVFLRSSRLAGVEYNILRKVPYGSEVITYSKLGEWAEVKVDGQEGFIASAYLLDSQDFNLLSSAWKDIYAQECIESSKCRMAILDYYKKNLLQGGTSGWQVYTKMKEQKPNPVYYPRLFNKGSKFTDFAFIVRNNADGNCQLVCYSFDDMTEKPLFRFSVPISDNLYIRDMRLVYGKVRVTFDDYSKLDIQI